MNISVGRTSVSFEHNAPQGVNQGQGQPAPDATGQTRLSRMSVQLQSAATTEARGSGSAMQHGVAQNAKSGVLLREIDSAPGPQLLSGGVQLDNPFSRTGVLVESANALAGGSDVGRALLSGATLTHVNPQDAFMPVMGANVAISGVSLLAGGLAIRQAFQQVSRLEAQLKDLPDENKRTADEQDRADRLQAQIKELKTGRNVTTTVVLTSVTVGLGAAGAALAGSAGWTAGLGASLNVMTVGLSVMGAMADRRQIMLQKAANEKLSAGLRQVSTSAPESDSGHLDSLKKVAEHAQTAGKSRVQGKWASLAYNVLTAVSGVAGLVGKVMVLAGAGAGAIAVASSVLLVTGGAVLVAGGAFAIYKGIRYKQNKSKMAQALIQNPEPGSPEMATHQRRMAKNKYYAVKQLALDIQTGRDDRNRTLDYFDTALGVTGQQADKLIRLFESEQGHAEGIQILSNALFRGRAVNL